MFPVAMTRAGISHKGGAGFLFWGGMLNDNNTITAGDTLKLDLLFDGYSPADSWLIWIALRGNAIAKDIKAGTGITVSTENGRYEVTVAPAVTATYAAGDYKYAVYMYKESAGTVTERYMVEQGTVSVIQDYAAMTVASDPRSHVKRVLDAIEAVIESRATMDQSNYSIKGRSLGRTPIPDLLKLRDVYRAAYVRELRAEKIALGIKGGNQIKVKL